ncbi:hypothetical protein QFC22_003456 [Naganishia vaughanmartiniae]|uniref:Uncharacterized protein n=1 Tax=Naganishia vaughanmartiniae TaxID=1424756 RepID=A0ACC2X8J3_9TREE|nr:hypothetical protein QFC22_003456 [Naganishia vaughanmartiniae]
MIDPTMPPRRTTRQSAASTADAEPISTPAPAPAKRTRAPPRAVEEPTEESADELDMEEPVKPIRRTRAPAKASASTSIPKESKAAATKRTATKPPAKSKTSTEPATKTKLAVKRKAKEVLPTTESENEEDVEHDPLANDVSEESMAAVPQVASERQEAVDDAADPEDQDEEDDEPTIRRAPSSAQQAVEPHPPRSSRRASIPNSIPAQTEDDALDALLSQSQHRSTHVQRSNSQLSVPATPNAPRTIPQTPAPQTARTRFVPGTVQGTAMKGKSVFPQTPGGVGRTPGASQSQHRVDGRDAKPVVLAPKKRLVIHKLVLVDFKSYAGRQEIGPFHKVGLQLRE